MTAHLPQFSACPLIQFKGSFPRPMTAHLPQFSVCPLIQFKGSFPRPMTARRYVPYFQYLPGTSASGSRKPLFPSSLLPDSKTQILLRQELVCLRGCRGFSSFLLPAPARAGRHHPHPGPCHPGGQPRLGTSALGSSRRAASRCPACSAPLSCLIPPPAATRRRAVL
jgi:hypothetical protein